VRLQAIYVFCRRTLIEARVERSAVKIGHVQRLLADLREAWAQVSVPAPPAAALPA
jgi:flagellar secretion chaperone FliS